MKDFATRLKESRAKLNLTQKDLAAKAEISAGTLSAYESGNKTPNIDTAMKLADILGVSLDWLCGRDGASVSDRLETCGDAIALIDKLLRSDLRVAIDAVERFDNEGHFDEYCARIEIFNSPLIQFFDGWKDVLRLYKQNTIGDEMYNPWLEKQVIKMQDSPLINPPVKYDPDELPF